MKLTGSIPTPIPAREPESPRAIKKVKGKVFDLVLEGQLQSKLSKSGPQKNQLAEFLQNPTLARYFYTWLNGK